MGVPLTSFTFYVIIYYYDIESLVIIKLGSFLSKRRFFFPLLLGSSDCWGKAQQYRTKPLQSEQTLGDGGEEKTLFNRQNQDKGVAGMCQLAWECSEKEEEICQSPSPCSLQEQM